MFFSEIKIEIEHETDDFVYFTIYCLFDDQKRIGNGRCKRKQWKRNRLGNGERTIVMIKREIFISMIEKEFIDDISVYENVFGKSNDNLKRWERYEKLFLCSDLHRICVSNELRYEKLIREVDKEKEKDVIVKNEIGCTALDYLCHNKLCDVEMLKYFLKFFPKASVMKNNEGKIPLYHLVKLNKVKCIVEYLKQSKIEEEMIKDCLKLLKYSPVDDMNIKTSNILLKGSSSGPYEKLENYFYYEGSDKGWDIFSRILKRKVGRLEYFKLYEQIITFDLIKNCYDQLAKLIRFLGYNLFLGGIDSDYDIMCLFKEIVDKFGMEKFLLIKDENENNLFHYSCGNSVMSFAKFCFESAKKMNYKDDVGLIINKFGEIGFDLLLSNFSRSKVRFINMYIKYSPSSILGRGYSNCLKKVILKNENYTNEESKLKVIKCLVEHLEKQKISLSKLLSRQEEARLRDNWQFEILEYLSTKGTGLKMHFVNYSKTFLNNYPTYKNFFIEDGFTSISTKHIVSWKVLVHSFSSKGFYIGLCNLKFIKRFFRNTLGNNYNSYSFNPITREVLKNKKETILNLSRDIKKDDIITIKFDIRCGNLYFSVNNFGDSLVIKGINTDEEYLFPCIGLYGVNELEFKGFKFFKVKPSEHFETDLLMKKSFSNVRILVQK